MMQVSFIVTTYNVRPYIRPCLDSLCAVVRPGDQVIFVDDGSSDGTADEIRQALATLTWPVEVELCPVFFGHNTHGGVGIAANIGLARASREAVFFVDGDDWLLEGGVQAAREQFAAGDDDILLANYRVFDEVGQHTMDPSDQMVWEALSRELDVTSDASAAGGFALQMNAVPWRKFYRRAFLQRHGILFPEGNFFFEDNPFHWQVCLSTRRIGFCDVPLACHRMNRPGQTMSGDGTGLAAIFQHYDTILGYVAQLDPAARSQADQWLATNMAWQLERLSPDAVFAYAAAAEAALCGKRRKRWQREGLPRLQGREIGFYLTALLEGGAQALIRAWLQVFTVRQMRQAQEHLAGVQPQLEQLADRQIHLEDIARQARDTAMMATNQAEFTALAATESPQLQLNDSKDAK